MAKPTDPAADVKANRAQATARLWRPGFDQLPNGLQIDGMSQNPVLTYV